MKRQLLKAAVRTRFRATKRDDASAKIREAMQCYLALAQSAGPDAGARSVRVPAMLGVDDDMREWSLFMILEHNTIVNRSITEVVRSLALDEEPGPAAKIDPKHDVMPSEHPGPEQIGAFRASVEDHLKTVADLPGLRGTRKLRHPAFGMLDAHGWHCMFALHLDVHLKQARAVARKLTASRA